MLNFQYKGDIYKTGQHYIEVTDGEYEIHIHVAVIVSKQEFPRFHAMITTMYGESVDTVDLCEQIKQYIFSIYRPHNLSAIDVAKMNTFGSGYDAKAIAEYLVKITSKLTRGTDKTTRKEQFKTCGIVDVNNNSFIYDNEPPEDADLIWFRSIYLTKVLGITEDQRKRHIMTELISLGLVTERDSGNYEFRLSIERQPYRGHILNLNYKETNKYKRNLLLSQERQERLVKLGKNQTLVKLYDIEKNLSTLNV